VPTLKSAVTNTKDVIDHPAVIAWRGLHPESQLPQRIELIENPDNTRLTVRLIGVGYDESNVIAKRSQPGIILLEQLLYEEILPYLPLTTVNYFGSNHEQGSNLYWIFLEDVSDERYHPSILEHRMAAANWLGIMHTYTEKLAILPRLPAKGTEYYWNLLQQGRNQILSFQSGHELNKDIEQILISIEYHYVNMVRRWNQFERICDENPTTLVHGDFISKNVAVRSTQDGITLLPFDWEKAGWSSPAEDISRIDIATYWEVVKDTWPVLSVKEIKRLASVGKVFRILVYLDWIFSQLEGNQKKQSIYHLERCNNWLTELFKASPWK
jgi:hypothetical protein